MDNSKKKGLQKAIEHFGGVAGLAEALGIKRQAVYMWAGQIPQARAYQIESITKGQLTAAELLASKAKRIQEARA